MLSAFKAYRKRIRVALNDLNQIERDFLHYPQVIRLCFYILSSFARIALHPIRIVVSIPLHVAWTPQESFTRLAERKTNGEFLDSYSQLQREQRHAVFVFVAMLVAVGIQLSVLGFGLVRLALPTLTEAVTTSKFIAFWDGAGAPPSGWTCISCAGGDDFYQKLPRGNATYGGTGGASTHAHTLSFVSSANNLSELTSPTRSGSTGFAGQFHEMTTLSGGTVGSSTSLPPYRDLKVIRYETPGNPSRIPSGVILIFNAAPTGSWTRYTVQDNSYLYGENDATTTGGSATHNHTFSGTATTPDLKAGVTGSAATAVSGTHTHLVSGASAAINHEPSRVDVLLYKATAEVPTPSGAIGLWSGTPPAGWTVVSGSAQTYDQRYLRGAAAYSASGGAATHAPGNESVTSDLSVGTAVTSSATPTITIDSDTAHVHTITVGFGTGNNTPPYRDAIIAQKDTVVSGTVSGRIFTDEGTIGLDCSTPRTVALRVNGAGTYSASCSNSPSNGSYSIASVSLSAGDIITVFVSGASEKAVTVTRSSNATITNFDLYQNRLIVRHEDDGPVSNADLDQFDSGGNADVPFTVTGGALTVSSGSELYVWTGMTFTPGGTVTTTVTGTAAGAAGDVHVQSTATLVMEANALSVGGDYTNSGTVSRSAGQTTTFAATGSGFTITQGTGSFKVLTFNGVSGAWTAQAAVTADESVTVTNGTFALAANALNVGSSGVTDSGSVKVASGQSLTQSTGSTTTILTSASGANCIGSDGASCAGTAGTISLGGLTIGNAATTMTTTLGGTNPSVTLADAGTITTSATLSAGSATLGVGSTFTNNGVFTSSTSTVQFNGTGNIAGSSSISFYKLTANGTTTLTVDATVTNALTTNTSKSLSINTAKTLTDSSTVEVVNTGSIIGAGTLTFTSSSTGGPGSDAASTGTYSSIVRYDATGASIPSAVFDARTYGGDLELFSNVAGSRTITFIAGTYHVSGNLKLITGASQSSSFDATGSGTNPTVNVTGNLSYTKGGSAIPSITSGTATWTVSGDANFTNGTYTATSNNTFIMDGTGTLTTASFVPFNLSLTPAISKTVTLANETHTLNGSLVLGGSGTITAGTSTIDMTGASKTIDGGGKALNNLTITNSTTLQNTPLTVGGILNVANTKTLTLSANLALSGNSGTTLNLNSTGSVIGAGTLIYRNSVTTVTTSGTISSVFRFDLQNGNMFVPDRGTTDFGGVVEAYNSSGATRTLTLGTAGSQTLTFASSFDLQSVSSGSTLTLAGNTNNPAVNITGSFTNSVATAATTVSMGTGVWTVSGNFDLTNVGTFNHNSGTLAMNGAGATLTSAGRTLNNVQVTGGTPSMADAAILAGNLTVSSGILTAPVSTLTIAGNLINSSSFSANGGTVVFNGAGTTSVTGATTFNNLTSTTAGKTIAFAAASGGTPVFTFNGVLTVTGTGPSRITLSSGTPGGQWLPHFNSAQSSVTYAIVKDSGCDTGTASVTLTSTTLNGGNNGVCWVFPTVTLNVNDGTGADLTYDASLTTLSGNWSIDDATNVDHYEYSIGTTVGGTDIWPYTSTSLVTNFTRSGLTLVNGTTYYVTVKALNVLSVPIVTASSNGVTVNTALPQIADGQTGDATARRTAGTSYNVDFAKSVTGPNLDYAQYAVYSGPNKTGTTLKDWTDIFTIDTASYTTDWAVDFASLQEGTNYVSVRAYGLDALSSELDDAFTVVKDTVAPSITSFAASATPSTAVLTWTTNEPATSQVEYGTTTSYGVTTTLDSTLTTTHSVTLTGLAAHTGFHARSLSLDGAGNSSASADLAFSTLANPQTIITNVQVAVESPTSVTVTWTTNEPATSKVRFGTTTAYGNEVTDLSLTTSHRMTITGLLPGTTYHYEVISTGSTTDYDADATFITAQAPASDAATAISEIRLIAGETIVTVQWTTNEPATSLFHYGITTDYDRHASNASLSATHRIQVGNLAPGTTYHYRLTSQGASVATTSDLTFTTGTATSTVNRAIGPTVTDTILHDGVSPTIELRGVSKGDQTIRVYLDGKAVRAFRTTGASLETVSFRVAVSMKGLALGRHELYLKSTDRVGRTSVVRQKITFTVATKSDGREAVMLEGAPSRYVVQKGDSLWSISKTQLGDGTLYMKILNLNIRQYPSLATTPNTLQPGWVLSIPAT